VLVCAGVGVVVTVAIAWTAAVRLSSLMPVREGLFTIGSAGDGAELTGTVMHERRWGVETFIVAVHERQPPDSVGPAWEPFQGTTRGDPLWLLGPDKMPAIEGAFASKWGRFGYGVADTREEQFSHWPAWLGPIPSTEDGLVAYGGRGAGWPFVTMRSLLRVNPSPAREAKWSGLARVRPYGPYNTKLHSQDPQNGTIPLWPHPWLFPLSVLMWGGGVFAAWNAALGIVRVGRRRRGVCLNCGYDLVGSSVACPECGSARACVLR